MDHNSPLISCKNDIKAFLESKFDYIDIKKSYINEKRDLPLKKTLITISRGKASVNTIAFSNYLSDQYDEENNEIVETQAKQLTIYYDLHIWNSTSPKLGGEEEIERIQEQLQSIVEFESNAMADKGITFFSFQEGTAVEDPDDNNLFHSRCTLEIKVLWKKEFRFEVMDEIVSHGEI
ncbi:hypothetical protein [Tepidibacter hydrothermalis]|uniref:Uncharacterized protein n=1 Tax=Tepidibacter hydrothermalis TaxID=3036126 RepID=A0ABY8EJU5_9FIRM|nr:hypothetical protein [Tepidibacter hydrothermalis]WFD12460.1 hypothetical protein P4S50_19975 [Tepidibacter hydrothermalis]